MPRRTLAGAWIAKQVRGLKLYLEVVEKERMKFEGVPEKTPERFEKLLPYALALGVEEQWAGQFESIYTTPPAWYEDRNWSRSGFNALLLPHVLHEFRLSSSRTLASPPHSSAASGGSGFGGGGSW